MTDCALVTAATFAVNTPLDAVAGTVIVPGTTTAELLLARATLTPADGADPDKLTVHASSKSPVIERLEHESPLTVGGMVVPVPLRLIVATGALLDIVNCPETEPALPGAYWTVSTAAWPGFSVTGNPPPDTENPAPVIASELIVTATVPLDVTVTDFVTAVPTATLPNASEAVLRLNEEVAAFNCSP